MMLGSADIEHSSLTNREIIFEEFQLRDRTTERRQTNSTATNPCCHGNEI